MSKRRLTMYAGSLQKGDLIVGVDEECPAFTVEREVPDVPTRLARRVSYISDGVVLNGPYTFIHVPDEWRNKDCTVILGKDECPDALQKLGGCAPCFARDFDFLLLNEAIDAIRARWPESFK